MRNEPVIECAQCGSVLSLHQNGLSIGQSAVFGTYGSVRRADISLNTPSISPHQRPSLILRIEENERAA